jgi:hypothetical protein
LFLLGCRSSEARRLESEARALAHSIDTLRNAPNQGKSVLLEALREKSCESAAVCQLKQQCVAAYESHGAALEASERARALLAEPDGGTRAVIAAAGELNRAEQQLEQARTLTDRCSSAQGELLRQVRAR